MAVSKSFFGLRRGSTKSHTYQVYRGLQVTKDRVYDVANPQSTAQMQQRLKLPMVAQAASVLKSLIDHSFEGTEYGEESIKKFRQLNLRSDGLNVTQYVPKGMINTGIADFTISTGSLPKPGLNGQGIVLSGEIPTINLNGTFSSAEFNTPTNGSAVTAEQIAKLGDLIWQNQVYDQLTILVGYSNNDYQFTKGNGETGLANYIRYVVSRIIFDEDRFSENKGWKWIVSSNNYSLTNGYINLDFETGSGSSLGIALSDDYTNSQVLMAGAITSDLQTDTWKRSSEAMLVSTAAESLSYNDVIGTYVSTTNGVSSTKYLNNGSEALDIAGGGNLAS